MRRVRKLSLTLDFLLITFGNDCHEQVRRVVDGLLDAMAEAGL